MKANEDKTVDDWARELQGKEPTRKVRVSEASAEDHFQALRKSGERDVELLSDEQMADLTDTEEDDR